MNRIIITILLTVIVILGGVSMILWIRYKNITAVPPAKIEILSNELRGSGRLILAEERVYQEYMKKFEREVARVNVSATVLFRWMTTFQYMIDLESPQFTISRDGNIIRVNAPAIILNDPLLDISTYKPGIVMDGSIWIDEHRLITDEMQSFREISLKAGAELMKKSSVIRLCTDQIKLAVLKIASGLQMQVDDIIITFPDEKKQ